MSENFYNYHVVQLADMYISKTSEGSLSGLQLVTEQEISFDLILLSAVWMHIPDSQRERFLHKFATGGKLVFSLRHGPSGDACKMHDASSELLINRARAFGLPPVLVTDLNKDIIGRDAATW